MHRPDPVVQTAGQSQSRDSTRHTSVECLSSRESLVRQQRELFNRIREIFLAFVLSFRKGVSGRAVEKYRINSGINFLLKMTSTNPSCENYDPRVCDPLIPAFRETGVL
jgi:hypothetical protein